MKPRLVLVHGALGSREQLEPLASLLDGDFDCRVIELEGHGATQLSGDRYSFASFSKQIAREIDDRAALFGYSMGGYAALLLAAESPDLVASVVTFGTKMAWSPETAAKETEKLNAQRMLEKVPAFAGELERRHRRVDGGWKKVVANTALLMTELGARPEVDSGVLSRISAPVRFLVGERDNVVSIGETEEAASRVGRGDCVILSDIPHPIDQVKLDLIAEQIVSLKH